MVYIYIHMLLFSPHTHFPHHTCTSTPSYPHIPITLSPNTHAQVDVLLSTFPKLSFLDLTQNPLDSTTFTPSPLPQLLPSLPPSPSRTLHTLVLNSTNIMWSALQVCLEMLHRSERLLCDSIQIWRFFLPKSAGVPNKPYILWMQFKSLIAVCSPKSVCVELASFPVPLGTRPVQSIPTTTRTTGPLAIKISTAQYSCNPLFSKYTYHLSDTCLHPLRVLSRQVHCKCLCEHETTCH